MKKKTNHIIQDISFSKNYILCVCGWSGNMEEFPPHQKEADPLPDIAVDNAWKRMYSIRLRGSISDIGELDGLK